MDSIAGIVTPIAIVLFVAVNGAFAAGVFLTRNRPFVDRWTRPVLMADAVLVAAAIGAPLAGIALELGAKGLVTLGAIPARMIPGK
jgi:hypothetical protein